MCSQAPQGATEECDEGQWPSSRRTCSISSLGSEGLGPVSAVPLKHGGYTSQASSNHDKNLEQYLVPTFKEYCESSWTGSNKFHRGFLESKTNTIMLREPQTYLAIKALKKLFNSATYRQTSAPLMEWWEVCPADHHHSLKSLAKAFRSDSSVNSNTDLIKSMDLGKFLSLSELLNNCFCTSSDRKPIFKWKQAIPHLDADMPICSL